MSKQESDTAKKSSTEDDEPDDWDKRIFSTGCAGTQRLPSLSGSQRKRSRTDSWITALTLTSTLVVSVDENAKLTDCYFEKKDWRQCAAEMEHFKSCWKQQGNDRRTDAKDA
ncbi:hypothetical protein CCUS01_12905 [Colletotrichum cuscutae]|uniref:CHCH domain-containing protein n=1 Tax=Colletotrichum cuscutae TaxID=1209917 RepID=A0AAJ0DQA2_9PEZI|nr:hypothetical protein CCUS01_12905 [Colletotrichum cuscutae]